MRLGFLGGSFDPVHYAHLLMAECCRESCELDEVWFLPAYVPPHKQQQGLSDPKHRVDMLKLAIGGHPAFQVSEMEIQRGGVSYTVQTLRELRERFPAAELFLLMGADSLVDLPTWREPAEICQLATPVVVGRPDWPEPDFGCLAGVVNASRLAQIQGCRVEMPLVQLSSSDIRARITGRQSIRYRTPAAVEQYIGSQRLYR